MVRLILILCLKGLQGLKEEKYVLGKKNDPERIQNGSKYNAQTKNVSKYFQKLDKI